MKTMLAMKLSAKIRPLLVTGALAASLAAVGDTPKYIFYFIGDGMGIPEVTNAQLYNKNVLKNEKPLVMTTFPVASMATTHSANSDVTDSAAAGTALATGVKTKNSMLGMSPDTTAVTSIAKVLFDEGYGVGLVTSVAIDDATPGAFYTHVANRSQFYDTGRFLAESGYHFAAGAALRGTKDKKGNDTGLLDYFAENNVSISYGLNDIDTTAERILVLSPFHNERNNSIGYAIDSIAGALTLPQLTRAGLDHLMRVSPDKFFMMVEGGEIDHAGHGNDGGTSLREVISLDESIRIAYEFYLQHPDETLIVVTADHETGGMSVGCAATGYSVQPQHAAAQKISKELFNEFCKTKFENKEPFSWTEMELVLRDKLGFWSTVRLNPDEEESIKNMFTEIFEKHNDVGEEKTLYSSYNQFVVRVFDILNYKSGFGWTTTHHTGSPVPVYAIGADCMLFTPLQDNTEIPRKILKAAGLQLPQ